MGNSKIEWTDKVWNPITGCSHSGSPGCDHCYAKRMAQRLKGRYGYPKDDPFKVTFHPDRLEEPLHWKKPSLIFVCSMGDLWHERADHFEIAKIWNVARKCKKHTFLFLTKRPDRLKSWTLVKSGIAHIPPIEEEIWPDNCWLGVSVEDQKTADERIPVLLQIPAAKMFVSVEPMLNQINLEEWLPCIVGTRRTYPHGYLDWVICGGLSLPGGKIQPPQREWVDSLVEQCDAAGVPLFIKPNAKYPIERRKFPNG